MSRRLVLLGVVAIGVLALLPAAPAMAAKQTRITVDDSNYGRMLWAPGDQAIYMFDQDKRDRSRCYGRCAKEWPPVLTKGRPKAGPGVDADLLGTMKRRNGDRQVTYAGRPLYTYAHEGPGEVLCHDVRLNGGLWWVLSPEGDPQP
jgi:predicted lipoprotein with Yx(FWY)xxD motif